MVFWITVGLVTLLALAWALYPLLKRAKSAPAARASYDIQVFKDQLAEIDTDEARGTISQTEAGRVRTEVSRRLLAAANAEQAERPRRQAPKNATYGLAALMVLAASLGGLSLYRHWGQPGLPDLPLSKNLAQRAQQQMDRPSQADAEAYMAAQDANTLNLPDLNALSDNGQADVLARLAEALKDRPDDLEGHKLLAQNLASIGRFIEAHAAQEQVMRILGDAATPSDHLDLAEYMILAAGGYVSPEAVAALNIVMTTTPENPRARYYAGLALAQYGKPRQAYMMWAQLLKEGPDDAPWIPAIKASIDALGREAGISSGAAPTAGPTDQQVQDSANMSDSERSDMIRSMVARLSERLASEGGSVEEWVQLIGANAVLGEVDAAKQALADAKAAYAQDPAALAQIEAAGAKIP